MHTYIHTCTHTCIHTYIHTCTHTHAYIHTYIHVHTHMHTYIHTYIYIISFRHCCSQNAVLMKGLSHNHNILLIYYYYYYSNPKLNYTIIYNATRALKLQQLVFGSPNKPDGRAGNTCLDTNITELHYLRTRNTDNSRSGIHEYSVKQAS